MNTNNYKQKIELLNELEHRIGDKRRYKAINNLESFIDIYLKHLSTNKRPAFHKVILSKIQRICL